MTELHPTYSSQNDSPASPVLAVSESFMPEERPRGRSTSIKPISTCWSPFARVSEVSHQVNKNTSLRTVCWWSCNSFQRDVGVIDKRWLGAIILSSHSLRSCWFLSIVQEIRSSWDLDHLPVVRNTKHSPALEPNLFLANVGHRSFYVKNLVHPGSSVRYIISLGRINCRLLKIHMIPFPKTWLGFIFIHCLVAETPCRFLRAAWMFPVICNPIDHSQKEGLLALYMPYCSCTCYIM